MKKDRRVIVDIIPCVVVTSLETDEFMAIVACLDKLLLRSNLSEKLRRRCSRSSCHSEKKEKVQRCVSQDSDPMNSIPRKVEELGLNASAGHTWNSQDALGTKKEVGKEKSNLEALSTRWTSWAKSLRARFWLTTTWRNFMTSRLYQQSSVEFGENMLIAEHWNYVCHFLVKALDTQKIACLLWIRELQCTMLSKENWAQWTIHWEGPKAP